MVPIDEVLVIVSCSGPIEGRRHDSALFGTSGWLLAMAGNMTLGGTTYCFYGDSGQTTCVLVVQTLLTVCFVFCVLCFAFFAFLLSFWFLSFFVVCLLFVVCCLFVVCLLFVCCFVVVCVFVCFLF